MVSAANAGFLLRTPPESVLLRVWESYPDEKDLDPENAHVVAEIYQRNRDLSDRVRKKDIKQLFPDGKIPVKKAIHAHFITEQASYVKMMEAVDSCPESSGFLRSLVMPIRTNNLRNLCKDLFFPTWMDVIKKRNNDRVYVFVASLYAIALDLATLILRIIALPFRYMYNWKYPKESSLLYRFLTEDCGVAKEALKIDSVAIEIVAPSYSRRRVVHFMNLPSSSICNRSCNISGMLKEDPWQGITTVGDETSAQLRISEKIGHFDGISNSETFA